MMRIEMDGGRAAFAPGDEIRGVVRWELPHAPVEAALRLGWSTRGCGDVERRDIEVVSVADLPRVVAARADEGPYRGAMATEEAAPLLSSTEVRRFSLVAPAEPYSFEGRLITLAWALTLYRGRYPYAVVGALRTAEIVMPLVIAPARAPVVLGALR
jgi:hypothetical protein